ncbi:hypothetical protein ACCS91_33655 [Rhizobium ruizarguesonis]|uniref:hypothetical protein n=1 Tax=Rhizobium ruizarguesonis TaxID=2081791 RepID=UPI00163B18BA|nr:hypothetical protein [Rhizobium ruizarguesonis]MBC2806618.1 hypothetical protein [Rhizobium ruizarguesonis]
MKLEDIDRKIAELQAMRAEAEQRADQEKLEAERGEALAIFDRIVEDVFRLNTLGFLPTRLGDALTDEEGKLNPRRFIKKRGNLLRGKSMPVSEFKSKAAKPHG